VERTVAIMTSTEQLDSRAAGGPGDPVQEAAGEQLVVGDIPREPPGFQPRPNLLARLDQAGTAVSVVHAVAEMQGAGKTQLAAAYARTRLATGWRLVAWINAEDTGSVLAGLAAVADAVGLSDGSTRWDTVTAGREVRYWLEADGDRCLIVFDGAADPDVLRSFLPTAGAARVLITSTRQSVANLGTSVPVDVFTAEEALAFLAGPTGLADPAGAAAVAAELEHHPLALAQATAVIAGHGLQHGTYLERLRAVPVDEYLVQGQGQPSVVRAVVLSLQAVRTADRAGVCTRVMEIMAMLSATAVRRQLLHAAGQAGLLAIGGHRVSAVRVDRALEWLSRRSLLTSSLDGQTITMHRLVAQVVRNGLARRQRLATMGRVAAAALEEHAIALARSGDRRAVRAIPQHVAALLDNIPGHAVEADKELARMLRRLRFVALYHLVELGDSTPQAIAVGEPLTADLERLLGPDHPETLNSRNSLAAAYLAAGRPADAIQLFGQILTVRQRVLGANHPDTLTSRNNLAAAYQDAGRTDEAIQLYEQNLAARERLLGVGHARTLTSRNNLAAAYRDAGRGAEAIALFERTLAARERVLGPGHPDTRTSRKNLAAAYQDEGRTDEAIPLFEQTSSGWPRLLSPDRPDTRTSRKNLASRDADAVTEIIPVFEPTLAARDGQPPASAAGQALPADLRRPPADPARRVLPLGFRRPPADPARWLAPGSVARPSGRARDALPVDVQDDREVAAAIAARDPAGIAMAYDRYAAALYGYCRGILRDPARAAEAMRDTFVIAAATLSALPEPPELRPWLYAVIRNECERLLRTPIRVRREQAGPEDPRAAGSGKCEQAELRTLIGAILAEMKPREHEVIELSFRHDLHGPDLAKALGMSSSHADALASRARDRLEKGLRALRVALTRREACPTLRDLLADWDGKLTGETCDLVDWHIEQCHTCAAHGRAALRPEALSLLLPLASLPPELRVQVLYRCCSDTEDAVAYRRRVARRTESRALAGFSQAIRSVSWDSIRAHPGAAVAAAAVVMWVAVAVSVTLLTFAGSRPAAAQVARPSVRTSSSRPAVTSAKATAPTSATKASPIVSHPAAQVPFPAQPSPTLSSSPVTSPSPSSSPATSPSPSSSPAPSQSSSSSPAASPSASPSSPPSPSAVP
jgi:RNA polymerase sigma factor (sigma-70 family)